MLELEIFVKIHYADVQSTISAGNIIAYLGVNTTNLIEMICGTALASARNVIKELPLRDQTKIKGFDVILNDALMHGRYSVRINLDSSFNL